MRKSFQTSGGGAVRFLFALPLLAAAGLHGQPCNTPSITAVTPVSWAAGGTVNIAIAGSNFYPTTVSTPVLTCLQSFLGVSVATGAVAVTNVVIASSTLITATVAPAATDPAEAACITVTTPEALLVATRPGTATSSACPPPGNFQATATAQVAPNLSAVITDTSDIMNGNITVSLTAPGGTTGDLNLVFNGSDASGPKTSPAPFTALTPGSQELQLPFDAILPGIYPTANGTWNAMLPGRGNRPDREYPGLYVAH